MREGIPLNQIQCNDQRILLESPAGRPVCVFDGTVEKLSQRGWDVVVSLESVTESISEEIEESTDQPIKSILDTVEEPTTNTPTESISEEPVDQPTEPITDTVEEPTTNTPTEPITDTVEEPITDTVEEPTTNTPTEPIIDTVEEPITDTVEEPTTNTPTEPTSEETEEHLDKPAEPQTESSPENDILYFLDDGHITTMYSPKPFYPDSVWVPIPLADAEILMQYMVKANDDKIIFIDHSSSLPCIVSGKCRIPEADINMFRPSIESDDAYLYHTEKGNWFSLSKKHASFATSFDIDAPHAIVSIAYTISEHIPYDQQDEFIVSLMNKIAQPSSETSALLGNKMILPGMTKALSVLDWVNLDDKPSVKIVFTVWANSTESI